MRIGNYFKNINSKYKNPSLMVCNDHEEVGSMSASGAQGPFLRSVIERIIRHETESSDAIERVIRKSNFWSIDNAHGIHPNYSEKHDNNHSPQINAGPVIKINANQRYASNSSSVALFKSICNQQKVPYQSFVMRSVMACGSTIGPMTSAGLGIDTLDIGLASFGIQATGNQIVQTVKYLSVLIKWNKSFNLVSTRDVSEILRKHFLAVSYTHLTLPTKA